MNRVDTGGGYHGQKAVMNAEHCIVKQQMAPRKRQKRTVPKKAQLSSP